VTQRVVKGSVVAKVVILGAGLTGLSAAYHLEKKNFFDFKIFEKESECGGLARSVKHDRFIFDFTGHLLHSSDKYFDQMLDELLSSKDRLSCSRKSFIFTHKTFIPYPFQTNLQGLPPEVVTECLCGFANRRHQIDSPRSFYDWTMKFFGAGIGKHFMFPYNQKLLQYNLKKVAPSWTGKFVPKTSVADIFSSFAGNGRTNVGYNASFCYPKSGGIQSFVDRLRNKVASPVDLNHKAVSVDLKKKEVLFDNGRIEKFEKLITSIPLPELLKNIKEPSNLNLKKNHSMLHFNSVLNFNVGFKLSQNIDKHWIYFPEKKFPFYRVGFWHKISRALAPSGHGSMYGEIAYRGRQDDHERLVDLSTSKALKIFGIDERDVVTQKTLHLPYAYVIYNYWRENSLAALHKVLNSCGLFSVGRYGEWKYSSMQDAILDGKEVANQILEKEKRAVRFIPARAYKPFLIDKIRRTSNESVTQ